MTSVLFSFDLREIHDIFYFVTMKNDPRFILKMSFYRATFER